MILYLLIQIIIFVVSLVFAPFPTVTELPWGIDGVVETAMGNFRALMEFFPPFSTVLNAFLLYIAFRLGILVLRFFLGSRTPTVH